MGSFAAEIWWQIFLSSLLLIGLSLVLIAFVYTGNLKLARERQRHVRELAESEEKFRTLVENTSDVLFVVQQDRFVFVNPTMNRLLGYTLRELNSDQCEVGRRLLAESRKLNLAEEVSGKRQKSSLQLTDARGRLFFFEVFLIPIFWQNKEAVLGVLHDLTEREQLEKRLRQAAKMEAIGNLAAGIAHDFNNLLTVINGNTELILQQCWGDNCFRGELEDILLAGKKAAELTAKLLAFSRQQIREMISLDVNEIIREMKTMLQRTLPENIRIVFQLNERVGTIKADPGQFEQIVLNLAINARDAMPEGGMLKIETDSVYLGTEYSQKHGIKVPPGRYVVLSVIDTGCGIPHEIQDRIFEPFFTTKAKGQGTGLGLSTVYGIVKQNDGFIWVYSEPGMGTTFRIYFPEESSEKEEPLKEQAFLDPEFLDVKGNETVLVVEDDKAIRDLVDRTLRKAGYQVILAENGEEAERNVAAQGRDVDVLLADVVLPGTDGKRIAERIRNAFPACKVIFMSGYDAEIVARNRVLPRHVRFLGKPFSPIELLQEVRAALDGE